MTKKLIGLLALLFLVIACTEYTYTINEEKFSQEEMAHAATLGSMYLTSSTQNGSHNCDDNPQDCCAAGYHMCTISEVLYGGRRIEFSGTGRDSTPYNTNGDIDVKSTSGLPTPGCNDWTSAAGGRSVYARNYCSYSTTISCTGGSKICDQDLALWCCSR